jgi:hypothetical protein
MPVNAIFSIYGHTLKALTQQFILQLRNLSPILESPPKKTRCTCLTTIKAEEVTATTEDKPGNAEILVTEKKTEKGANFFANFSSIMGNATTVIKDKVSTATMIGEFNKEQDDFIKSKGTEFKV